MPITRPPEAEVHEAHGATFHAYVAPSRGSRQLCAWRVTVPAGQPGAPHRPSHEEVLLVLSGDPIVTVDGERHRAAAGDVVLVPAGAELLIEGGTSPAALWVTTTPGLHAVLTDGTTFSPPWAT